MIQSLSSATSTLIFVPSLLSVTQPLNAPEIAGDHGLTTFEISASRPQTIKTGQVWIDRQLATIAALPSDWDGYGSDRIDINLLNRLGNLLKQYSPQGLEPGWIVPGADGSLQAEWHINNISFGIVVEEGSPPTSWWRNRTTGEDREESGPRAVSLFLYYATKSLGA